MRILQIITLSELGGAQSVVVNLANKLSEQHEVIVAAGEGDGKMFQLLSSDIRCEKIPSLVRRLSPGNEVKAIIDMRRLFKRYKPDIIHLHSSKAGILGRIAFPSKRIVYTVHGFDSIRLAYRKFLPLEKMLQFRSSAIVGVSRYDEKNLHSEGINHNVGCIYNGIYEPTTLHEDPFSKLRNYKGIVLCIARLSPPKNHKLFIDLAKRMQEYAFVWIGNQEEPSFDFPENVYFWGNIPNAGAYTQFADLFFLPSNYEGLPIVIIESLSKGTPVIASAVGGIKELLNGCNGWAIENDAEKMYKAISHYFNLTSIERKAMSESARSTYLSMFTVEKMTEGYLKEYYKILDK